MDWQWLLPWEKASCLAALGIKTMISLAEAGPSLDDYERGFLVYTFYILFCHMSVAIARTLL